MAAPGPKARALESGYANHGIVTLAVFLLGGDSHPVDTEDIAVKANELAPGRFSWRKYPEQINLEYIRVYLSDAKKPGKGGYLLGSGTDGWTLTEAGLSFARTQLVGLAGAKLERQPMSARDRQWHRAERARLVASDAHAKLASGDSKAVTRKEVEAFFRVDEYVVGKARQRKVERILTTFGDDPDLGTTVRELGRRIREDGR